MPYFHHDNYLKIDNKPVFFLHHPWFLTVSELNIFKQMLNHHCLNANFDGIYFIVNNMNDTYSGHLNYNFHFNYKKNQNVFINENNKRCIDYEKYIKNIDFDSANIQTLVFDFDNSARLCNPNRLHLSTTCINNSETNIRELIKNTINSYKNKAGEINKILLVNSWNEWGERMAAEPSNERGNYYLKLLNKFLNLRNST